MLLYIPLEIISLVTLMKSCKIYTYQYMLIDPQGLCSKRVLFKGITYCDMGPSMFFFSGSSEEPNFTTREWY